MKFSMPVSGRHWHLLSELSSSTNCLEIIPNETPPISVMFSCIKIYPKPGGMFNVYEYWLADSSNWGMKKWGWWLIATDATLQAWVLWRDMWLWPKTRDADACDCDSMLSTWLGSSDSPPPTLHSFRTWQFSATWRRCLQITFDWTESILFWHHIL